MGGHTRDEKVYASQAQSRCFMPVDEPQGKSEAFRFRMSMALFKGRDGKTSVATTGVKADAGPSSSGLIRDQCCKASAAGYMESRPEEESRPHGSIQESKSTRRVQSGWRQVATIKGLIGFLPLTKPTALDSITGGVECLHCLQALSERELRGSLGLCQWCLDRNDEYLIDRKQASGPWREAIG